MKISVDLKSKMPSSVLQLTRKIIRNIGMGMVGLATKFLEEGGHTDRRLPLITRSPKSRDSVLECCIAYNRYGGYCIPLSSRHTPTAQKILGGRVHEPNTIEFISAHSGSGSIIHAGTYFGDFIPALSEACSADSKVWAFEPNPENYRCASITSQINSAENVRLQNAGLGSRKNQLPLKVRDSDSILGGQSKFLDADTEPSGETTEGRIVTIDDTIPSDADISVIHLDVEGFEKNALKGGIKTMRRCKPALILEKPVPKKWVKNNLTKIGYKNERQIESNEVFKCK